MAFLQACVNGDIDLVKELSTDNVVDHTKAFVLCCQEGHFEIVKQLYPIGINIRGEGKFSLVMACRGGHIEIAKWLHSLGSDDHFFIGLSFDSSSSL